MQPHREGHTIIGMALIRAHISIKVADVTKLLLLKTLGNRQPLMSRMAVPL